MIKQHGIGLPEVMISLLLSSLVMSALMNHYISVKRHYCHFQSAMDDEIELQLVADFMRDSIRQAGFTPCLSIDHLTTLLNLSGIDVGSDLNIHRMSPYFDVILDGSSSTRLLLTHNNTIRTDRPILIADCYHAEIQHIQDLRQTRNEQIVTLKAPLVFSYQPPVYVGEWLQERFFIRPLGGLYYQREHPEELTPLVKTMSIELKNKLVQVSLGLKGGRTFVLETKVRTNA